MGSVWSWIGGFFGINPDGYSIHERTYTKSNFRVIYKNTDKHQTIASVLRALKQLKNPEFAQFFTKYSIIDDEKETNEDNDQKYSKIDALSVGDVAVKCWTLQRPKFYGALKRALLTDNKIELNKWMPFIRALNSKLVCQNPPTMKCYRGSKMSLKDFSIFKYGYVYRIPYYVATSVDEEVAKSWPNSNYLIQFNIPKGCPNASSISELSVFPNEKEVLLPPYTAVRVTAKSSTMMVVDVLDNFSAPKDAKSSVMKVDDMSIKMVSALAGLNLYGGLAGTSGAMIGGLAATGANAMIGGLLGGPIGACIAVGSVGGMVVMSSGVVDTSQIKVVEENKFVD
eukprot:252178_1